MSKTCGDCKYYIAEMFHCSKYDVMAEAHNTCEDFEPKVITNGDKIIAGGMRAIAKGMVYGYRETDDNGQVIGDMLYTWKHPQAKVFDEYNEAVDYLEAWLNAPAKSEGEE